MTFVMSLQILNIYILLMIQVYYIQIKNNVVMKKNILQELQIWFIANKLSSSIGKTNYMIFSKKYINLMFL